VIQEGDWLGLFTTLGSALPELTFCLPRTWTPPITFALSSLSIVDAPLCYSVLQHSRLLQPTHPLYSEYVGVFKRVRIVSTPRGSAKKTTPLLSYTCRLDSLPFNPGRWVWPDNSLLLSYTAKKGRSLIHPCKELEWSIPAKWQGLLPASYSPKWKDVWQPRRSHKDAAFMWSVFHGAVAFNTWRAIGSPNLDLTCVCCDADLPESLIHWFYQCQISTHAWHFAMSIMYHFVQIPVD
jgi:hypothetical protein